MKIRWVKVFHRLEPGIHGENLRRQLLSTELPDEVHQWPDRKVFSVHPGAEVPERLSCCRVVSRGRAAAPPEPLSVPGGAHVDVGVEVLVRCPPVEIDVDVDAFAPGEDDAISQVGGGEVMDRLVLHSKLGDEDVLGPPGVERVVAAATGQEYLPDGAVA